MKELYFYRFVMVCLLVAAMFAGVRRYGDYRVQQFIRHNPAGHGWMPTQVSGQIGHLHPPAASFPSSAYSAAKPEPSQRMAEPTRPLFPPVPAVPEFSVPAIPSDSVTPAQSLNNDVLSKEKNRTAADLSLNRGSVSMANVADMPHLETKQDDMVQELLDLQNSLGGSQIASILGDSENSGQFDEQFRQAWAGMVAGHSATGPNGKTSPGNRPSTPSSQAETKNSLLQSRLREKMVVTSLDHAEIMALQVLLESAGANEDGVLTDQQRMLCRKAAEKLAKRLKFDLR